MKNLTWTLVIIALVFGIQKQSYAQKNKKSFQGTITYDIKYVGENLTPAQKAQMPTTIVTSVKDCKTKTEMVFGGMTQTQILDGTSKTEIVLIDLMGTKYAIKLTESDLTESLSKLPASTVNNTSETKTIAGYLCKKAIVTSTEDDGTVNNDTIFYTEDIGCKDINFISGYKDIPGMVLEYTQNAPEIQAKMYFSVKEIKKSKISDNAFLIPSDYQEVTKDELKKLFGGE